MNDNLNENLDKSNKLNTESIQQEKEKTEEDIEQEAIVLIQFTDLDDANYCEKFSHKFKTIEITETNPIIQIGNRLYQGEYQNNIGTYLYFEETKSTDSSQKHQPADYNYYGKSFKKLVLTRLFVDEREKN